MHKVLKSLLLFFFIIFCFQVEAKSDKNEKSIDFDIPAQRADLSLISFAEQANMTLLFPFNKLKEKQANRLFGKHSIKEGLSVLLKNTGLEANYRKNGQLSITINSNLEEDNMKNIPKKTLIATLLASFFAPTAIMAAETDDSADEGQKVLIIGSRSRAPRTIADSPVPVDILSADDLNAMGGAADLTDNLKMMVPSYTATPATGDGSAFVRTTSLRGTAPDQTLVLVDGKRRHRSALIQLFAPAAGQGAHGADVGMVPAIALKRVEVLRDGAASQYGSDAIAGVINFVSKDASDGGSVELQYGQHYEGESSLKFGFNKGIKMGENGFANFSLEYVDNENLNRSIQHPKAQTLIDAGVTGVGADSPYNDGLAQTWGRPETSGLRTFLNMGIDLGESMNWYGRVGYGSTEGRYRFFYRDVENNIFRVHANDANGDEDNSLPLVGGFVFDGFTGVQADVGFTPFLDGEQTDISVVTGIQGDFAGGTYFDFSVGFGSNELDYYLNNSINPSLGLTADLQIPQFGFDTGGLKQEEINLNADFSTPVGDNFNFAYGAEWREETYTTIAGEINSWADANGVESGGVSGMKGITDADAGSFSRDNYAVYADIEHDVTSDFFLQYALRYEDFSDFGTTVNWKIASRFSITDSTALRGAISTGFHAPTPGQANYKATITTFDTTGELVEEGVIASTDPLAVAAGGKELKEEESTSISFGITSDIGESTTLTVDYYQIAVDDRIYRTGGLVSPTGRAFSFYTNALDVEHSGIDIVLTTDLEWSDMTSTNVSLAYGYNEIDVVGQSSVETFVSGTGSSAGTSTSIFVNPVSQGSIDNIENNFPNNRWVVTANTSFGDDWNFMLRGNYYGDHFDERGSLSDGSKAKIDSVFYVDAEVAYQVTEVVNMKFGFSNIFDTYVNKIDTRRGNGLEYPRRSAANYEGGSWYLKASYEL